MTELDTLNHTRARLTLEQEQAKENFHRCSGAIVVVDKLIVAAQARAKREAEKPATIDPEVAQDERDAA